MTTNEKAPQEAATSDKGAIEKLFHPHYIRRESDVNVEM